MYIFDHQRVNISIVSGDAGASHTTIKGGTFLRSEALSNAGFCHLHDYVIKWKLFPRYWPFVRGIHWSPMN